MAWMALHGNKPSEPPRLRSFTFNPAQLSAEIVKLFSVCFDCAVEIPSRRHALHCALNQAGAFPVVFASLGDALLNSKNETSNSLQICSLAAEGDLCLRW